MAGENGWKSFVLNKKGLILFNTMDKMNKKQQGSICHDEKVAYRPLIIWWLKFRKLLEYTDKEKTLHPKPSERLRKEKWEKQEKTCALHGGTILNMVTLSHSLDIPKAERSRNFSETDIISAECSFSARSYLYRIFKLKEGCTPAEWREKMAENVAAEDKKQD